MRIGNVVIGFMLLCPWRIQTGKSFEYWWRYQLGPFYVLRIK